MTVEARPVAAPAATTLLKPDGVRGRPGAEHADRGRRHRAVRAPRPTPAPTRSWPRTSCSARLAQLFHDNSRPAPRAGAGRPRRLEPAAGLRGHPHRPWPPPAAARGDARPVVRSRALAARGVGRARHPRAGRPASTPAPVGLAAGLRHGAPTAGGLLLHARAGRPAARGPRRAPPGRQRRTASTGTGATSTSTSSRHHRRASCTASRRPAAERITLASRSGEMPIWLRSRLDYPVTVAVRLESDKLDFPDSAQHQTVTLARGAHQGRLRGPGARLGHLPAAHHHHLPRRPGGDGQARSTVRSTAVAGWARCCRSARWLSWPCGGPSTCAPPGSTAAWCARAGHPGAGSPAPSPRASPALAPGLPSLPVTACGS